PATTSVAATGRAGQVPARQAAGADRDGLLYRELGRVEALVEDILLASLDSCVLQGESLPRDGAALAALAERKRAAWNEHAERLARLV
ncbi:hypothetical protein U8M34_27935, partial [Klebsiella pneumoniae]|uniref:hypothetical protein n=1 Tax=Klebsiella pneumoniae TaxID=573 RepID=UPI002ADF9868